MRSFGQRLAAAGIVFAVPAALWYATPPHGLTAHGWHAGLIVLAAALAWLLEPVPDFVVALAMAAAWGLAGLVPLARAFAGFTSPSYAVALGALGLVRRWRGQAFSSESRCSCSRRSRRRMWGRCWLSSSAVSL